MALIDEMLAEIDAAQAEMEPIFEGWQDYQRTLTEKDGSATRQAVGEAINVFDTRLKNLATAETALLALKANGHPEVIQISVTADVEAVLQSNLESVTAAFDTVVAKGEAVAADVDLGTVTPR